MTFLQLRWWNCLAFDNREILGFDIGFSEEVAFWAAFLRDLVARGTPGRPTGH